MSWFKRDRKSIESSAEDRRVLTEGLWIKCEAARSPSGRKTSKPTSMSVPKCGFHYKITAYERLNLLLDEGWTEFDSTAALHRSPGVQGSKSLQGQHRYAARKESAFGMPSSMRRERSTGISVIVSAMEYNFIGGSMGSVVGEKITRAIERPCGRIAR